MSSRSSKKRPSDKSTSWSEWTWDAARGEYYKVRTDSKGQWEYHWDERQAQPSSTYETPRTTAADTNTQNSANVGSSYSANNLADDFSNTSLTSASRDSSNYVTASSYSPGGTSRSQPIQIPTNTASGGGGMYPSATPSGYFANANADTDQWPASYSSYSSTPRGDTNPLDGYQSARTNSTTTASAARQPNLNEASGGGDMTQNPIHRVIRGTKGKEEKLDTRIKVHKSHYFQPGEVFKVLWSEPKGDISSSNATVVTQDALEGTADAKYGEQSFSKIRRFVIVAADHGHCQCVPILTYQYQGTTKSGVKRDEHAIIYTSKNPPGLVEGEAPLHLTPIKVVPNSPRDKLDPTSRVNYAKIYTVEHNVKVHFIGRIADNDRWRFNADFDATWNKKRLMNA